RGLNGEYWGGHVRQTVRFREAIETLIAAGFTWFVEIGPHPVLAPAIAHSLRATDREARLLSSLRRSEPDRLTMLTALGALYCGGAAINFEALFPGKHRVV